MFIKRTITVAALVVASLSTSTIAPATASAHVPDCRRIAVAQALADERPATAALVRQYRVACVRVAARHALTHAVATGTTRCLRTANGRAGTRVCAGLARAAAERGTPSWAWSPALHNLLQRESSHDPNAVNENGGACGLFQRYCCPWRYYGGTASPSDDRVYSTPLEQARNGLRYIDGRYGTPDAAWGYWQVHHVY